jgi:hypothetical protein
MKSETELKAEAFDRLIKDLAEKLPVEAKIKHLSGLPLAQALDGFTVVPREVSALNLKLPMGTAVVRARAWRTDQDFGYDHWRAAEFSCGKGTHEALIVVYEESSHGQTGGRDEVQDGHVRNQGQTRQALMETQAPDRPGPDQT